VGAIAGGIIGGVLVLGAILAFVWYNRKGDNRAQPKTQEYDINGRTDPRFNTPLETYNSGNEQTGVAEIGSTIRYPENILDMPSGRVVDS
jgi:hypothetical protein